MSVDEKLDPDMLLGLIEDELEERKTKKDRRQKDCEESMLEQTEVDRRVQKDRRKTS